MTPGRLAGIVGLFVGVAVAFYAMGRVTRPAEDWSRQRINRSSDPKEFRNSFLGLTVEAPAGDDWQLVWEPAKFRYPMPLGLFANKGNKANKVLEIIHIASKDAPEKHSVAMDLFVQPLTGKPVSEVVRELEFRERRPGFRILSEEETTIGGLPGHVRVCGWAVGPVKSRSVNYYVENDGKLFAFIGVADAGSFDQYRLTFGDIIATVQLR
jgi:hypothetical protein